MTQTSGHKMSDAMQKCIDACTECEQSCLAAVAHCLELGGKHAENSHIQLLLDCAEMCRTSISSMLRGSQHQPHVCGLCATICTSCAVDCERFADDDMMRQCAEICRRCAESCQSMSKMSA